jgi:ferredoxin/flavodoxin
MDIDALTLAYFSPTRTTRRIVEAVALGLEAPRVRTLDLTPAEREPQSFARDPRGLTVIGAPVYAGRLPADMVARLRALGPGSGPAVVVVAYGNRAYEDALLELADLAREAGFTPVAAGAFIGEHSYSLDAAPIAPGRPDPADLAEARTFGGAVRGKLARAAALTDLAPVQVPGNFPYKEAGLSAGLAPAVDEARCALCGECVPLCPVGAIPAEDPLQTRADRCIRCCACVKFCPTGARTLDHPRITQFREFMARDHAAPKRPELFL